VKPPPNRKEKPPVILFSVWTPKDGAVVEEGAEGADKLPEMHNT